MLVRVIAPFITSDGAQNPGDQFELEDTLTAEYINNGLVAPVPVVKAKETAINPAAK